MLRRGLAPIFPLLPLLLVFACGRNEPAREPSPTTPPRPALPFFIAIELRDIDLYRDGVAKDLGVALLQPLKRRVTLDHGVEMDRTENVPTVFTKVPLARFPVDVAPVVERELTVPFDVGVIWRPGFFDASVEPVAVQAAPLADFDDIATAEVAESHARNIKIKDGQMTEREAAHAGVRVTLTPEGSSRIAEFARKHKGAPLAVRYDRWFAGQARAGVDDEAFDFRFSWLDDEGAASKAARDFVAKVNATRRRRP